MTFLPCKRSAKLRVVTHLVIRASLALRDPMYDKNLIDFIVFKQVWMGPKVNKATMWKK